jgi:hypothetical protein
MGFARPCSAVLPKLWKVAQTTVSAAFQSFGQYEHFEHFIEHFYISVTE